MTDFKETPQGNDRLTIPEQFRQRFNQLAEGIYPQAVIASIRQENYNPIIIGYDHPSDLSDLPQIKKRFETIQQAHPEPQLKVALEVIPPIQLKWIKDFLPLEEEYKKHGTVHGEIPRQTPDQYRQRLLRNHAEHLALWLLDNGFNVTPIEHPDVQAWIRDDSRYFPEEETFFGTTQPIGRQFLSAIRRDLHSLEFIQREKPDVVSVGTPHALKFDILLNRNEDRSFYYLQDPILWDRMLAEWERAHNLYRSLRK